MSDIKELTKKIIEFRKKRDWKQFHNPKDTAISLALEANEYLELFQWKNGKDLDKHIQKNKKIFEDELADVMYWILLISHDMGIDIKKACDKKLIKTRKKYPVNKAKGNALKYYNLK